MEVNQHMYIHSDLYMGFPDIKARLDKMNIMMDEILFSIYDKNFVQGGAKQQLPHEEHKEFVQGKKKVREVENA